MKLEIGCGDKPRKGYLHLDVRNLAGVDIVGFAWDIPKEDSSFEEIFSRHSFEHYTYKEAIDSLKEFKRVLKEGGYIHLIMPNLDFHIIQYFQEGKSPYLNVSNRQHSIAGLYGWQRNDFDVHKWGWTRETLFLELDKLKYKNITFIPCRECDLEVKAYK